MAGATGRRKIIRVDTRAWIIGRQILVRRVAIAADGCRRHMQIACLAMKAVTVGCEVLFVTIAAGLRESEPGLAGVRHGYPVGRVAGRTNRTCRVTVFPGLPVRTAVAPDAKYQGVATAAQIRTVGMRHGRFFIVDSHGLVAAVAHGAGWRIVETGNE